VQTGEPQARNLLAAGSVTAALVSEPPSSPYPRPVVEAPIAASGFAIAFDVDNARHDPVQQLRLTPRLLAKLLTESYPAEIGVQHDHVALSGNPLNIAADPEFVALNPGIATRMATEGAATILALGSNSDVTRALTSYLDADPEARAGLDGTPDPWGMVVNPAYRHIALPVDVWPLLDTFIPESIENTNVNDCLAQDKVPFLPLVASPVSRMESITLAMQFSLLNSQTVCALVGDTSEGEKLVAQGRQTSGYRFMLGVTSLGDAHRYGLRTASLQTAVSPGAAAKFTSTVGRTFVAPTDASLAAAARLLRPDSAHGMWALPYASLHAPGPAAAAYPGFMLVYVAAPTSGLKPASDASRLADFVRFAAGTGQVPGSGNGRLPAGFLPLTDGNGLGAQARYAQAAAGAIAAQTGDLPPLSGQASTQPPVAPSTPASSGPDAASAGAPPASAPTSGAGSASSKREADAAGASTALVPVVLGSTRTTASALGDLFLPVTLGVGLLCLAAGPTWGWLARRRASR
jgi:hypothetical protein